MGVFWICLLGLTHGVVGDLTHLKWSSCNTNPNTPLNVIKVDVQPMPILLPGDMSITIMGNLTRPVGESDLELTLNRKSFLGKIHIPCLLHYGSCTYPNLCTLVDEMIQNNWATISTGLGNQIKDMLTHFGIVYNKCPQPAQALRIDNYKIKLPKVPAVLSWFAEGDYSAKIVVREARGPNGELGEEIMCINGEVTVKEACTGFLCRFGK